MAQIKLRYVNEYVDRTGKVRRYFRKGKGARRVALHGLPGSDEFMAASLRISSRRPPRQYAKPRVRSVAWYPISTARRASRMTSRHRRRLCTAQRVGDVATRTRQHVKDGEIYVVQEKTGAELWIPIHADLALALKAYPANGLALIGKSNGRPLSQPGLSALMARAIDAAGLPGRCVAHGLRKAAARRLAEAGCTEKQIAAITGHKSLREIERYTKAADQRKLARDAMGKV